MIGIRTRDHAGNIVIDPTTSLPRVHPFVATGTSDGYVDDPDLVEGEPWYSMLYGSVGNWIPGFPLVTISGTRISWQFPPASRPQDRVSAIIVYGTR